MSDWAENTGTKRQKLYCGSQRIVLELAMLQLIESFREFAQHQVGDGVICGQVGETTHLAEVPRTQISLSRRWISS